jgi:sec-independent protein translocase protein TatC
VGAVTSRQLRKGRRWAVLTIVVFAAVITPSGDPLTLMLLAVPMYVLYEAAILAVRWILRK